MEKELLSFSVPDAFELEKVLEAYRAGLLEGALVADEMDVDDEDVSRLIMTREGGPKVPTRLKDLVNTQKNMELVDQLCEDNIIGYAELRYLKSVNDVEKYVSQDRNFYCPALLEAAERGTEVIFFGGCAWAQESDDFGAFICRVTRLAWKRKAVLVMVRTPLTYTWFHEDEVYVDPERLGGDALYVFTPSLASAWHFNLKNGDTMNDTDWSDNLPAEWEVM